MKKIIMLISLSWGCFLALPGSYAARCVDIMSAIENVKNEKKDLQSMVEDLQAIISHPQSSWAERELAIKFLTTIASKKELYFQRVFSILSDVALTSEINNQSFILESLAHIILQITKRDVAYQAIDKWNEITLKLKNPIITTLSWNSFELSEKYPEKFLLIFNNIAKIVAEDELRRKEKLFKTSSADRFISYSLRAILKLPEKHQKEAVKFLQSNFNDQQHSETLRQIYFKVYGEIANNLLHQILDKNA